jgi:ABC-2 type transport system ATP-binding protein
MKNKDLIEVEALRVSRGSFVLELPSWSLHAGQIVGLVGPNGAGKTTLIETLAGLDPKSDGRVSVFGMDPWAHPDKVRLQLGFMSDDLPLFALPIRRLLKLVSGYYPTWDEELVWTLVDRFKLDPDKKVQDLSKGQGTRIRLILAMAFRPRVLLLDEPASGLDLKGRIDLLKSVLDVVQDPGRAVMVSSHMLGDVERIADALLVLNDGRVVKEGPTDTLVKDGQTLEEAMLAWGSAG